MRADHFFLQSIQERPADWRAYAGLGFLSTERGQLAEGVKYWQQAAGQASGHPMVAYHFGIALDRKGEFAKSIAVLRIAKAEQKFTKQGDQWKKVGNLQAAQEYYERALQINPAYEAAQLSLGEILEGNALKSIENGAFHEAEIQLQKSTFLSPHYKKVHYLLGLIYYRQGRLLEAERSLLEDLHWRPDHAWSHSLLGDVYKAGGCLQASQAAYHQAILHFEAHARDHPENASALNEKLGKLYSQIGLRPKAGTSFQEAIQPDENTFGLNIQDYGKCFQSP